VTPGLSKAREATTKLLERWDPALLDAAFDPQSLKYAWLSSLKQDFEKLRTDHGRCKSSGAMMALSRARGRWRMTCDRGAIELTVLLTPSNPPRIQMVEWKQELLPDEKARNVAKQLTALVSRWSDAAGDKLFASGAEEAKRATRLL